ncbi:MAG: peptidoglycan DD-metalloendopeptidase family protein [Rhizobiales bacterium]|nr:peptidoglycan DD-metalloendopeptidase family protein [Hyphomicrobiales bacterium]
MLRSARPRPNGDPRRLLVALVAGVALSLSMASFSQAETLPTDPDNARARLGQTEEQLRETLARERNLASDALALERERAAINGQLIEIARQIQEGEGKLSELEGRLGELSEQRQNRITALRQEHRNLSRLLAALQRMGRNPPPVIATPEADALAMVRSAMLLSRVFPELRQKADALAMQIDELSRVVAEYETRTRQLRAETDRLRTARAEIAGLLETKRTRLVDTQTELAEIRRLSDEYRRSVGNLNELIGKLDRAVADNAGLGAYESELAAAAEAAPAGEAVATPPSTPAPPAAGTGAAPSAPAEPVYDSIGEGNVRTAMLNPGRIKPALPFAKAQGALPLPASGTRLWGFGDKTPHGSTSQGIALETRHGAQITSPNDGWVIYAGPFLSYGELLIINAGGGYHVLLAGLSSIDVVVGQFVLSGEPVGRMPPRTAEAGDEEPPIVYVEFRRKGKPIDPDPWWAESPRKVQG